ncbi:MAG: lysine--tRNA ligase, partial [Methylococcales bacterium]|nr:lysine--tRNA ligase [Methylococcales bacterium]
MSEIQLEEQEQIAQRRAKLQDLREKGLAFPTSFRRTVIASELFTAYEASSKEALDEHPIRVKVAGRVMTRRIMGKASFCHIQDMSDKLQLYVARDNLEEGFYNEQFKKWDI